jgi:tRNA G10  N-methylase Trm11
MLSSRSLAKQAILPQFAAPIRHPARFSAALLPTMARYLRAGWYVLDPFGGVGGLARLGITGARCVVNEIEWNVIAQAQGKYRVAGNALALPFAAETFDAVVTSPTYGNRMADHHRARDASRRNTYFHAFGGAMHADNTGLLQWGAAYRERHARAWGEAARVLKRGGLFLLNVSDHIRDGRRVYVSKWHLETVRALGMTLRVCHAVQTPRLRWGANGEARCAVEYVFVFGKSDGGEMFTAR